MPLRLDETARGVYTIAATPFTDAGEVDWSSVDTLVDFYLRHGVDGVTILGIMGEAHKLTDDESRGLVRRFLTRLGGRIPVVVGVSSGGMSKLVDLARRSMDAGAAGVMVAPLQGAKTDDEIVRYFGQVAQALGPDVPLVVQDYPQTTNADVSPPALVRIVEENPSVVMLKHEDAPGLRKLSYVRRATDAGRRISILVGNGGLHAPQELRRGADGVMTGFSYPEMLVRMVALFAQGDPDAAEDVFDAYLPVVRHEQQPGIGLAIRKEILRRRGAIASAATRAPGPRLDADDLRELDRLVARLERRLGVAVRA